MTITPLVCERKQTVFLTGRRMRGFYLEIDMKTKVCRTCKKRLPIGRFYFRKKWGYRLCCNHCLYMRMRECDPWINHFKGMRARCNGNTKGKGYIGKIAYLTKDDMRYLWSRDKAWLLKQPSLHRIDNNGHYTLGNCAFIELKENTIQGVALLRMPVLQLDLDGEIINKFSSQLEAARCTGIHSMGISRVVRGLNKTAGGYKWKNARVRRGG